MRLFESERTALGVFICQGVLFCMQDGFFYLGDLGRCDVLKEFGEVESFGWFEGV